MSERFRLLPLAGGGMLIAALLAGCASAGTTPGGSPPSESPDPAPTAEAAPGAFTERETLPSCGSVELGQGETIPQDAIDCLAAAGPEGAELVVTAPTVEGDPIVTYYRALPGGGIEVFADMTADAFGGGWSHDLCEDAVTVDEYGGCAGSASG